MIDDLSVTADNFADGNIFVCFRKTIQKLIASLQYECETAFNWSSENMIISNPGKFQIIPSNKIKQTTQMELQKLISKKIRLHVQ